MATRSRVISAIPNAFLTALGLAILVGGVGYGVINEGGVGLGFLPAMSGVLVTVFAIIELVIEWRRTRPPTSDLAHVFVPELQEVSSAESAQTPEGADVDLFGRTQKQRSRMLWTVMAMFLAAVALVPILGFIISFALLIFSCAVFVEKRRVVPSALVTAITMAIGYLIFGILLGVPLPQGIFGIL
jgi:putative tricarboxylic transport membrane protein